MKILVLNSGSSSIKYQFIDMDGEKPLASGQIERIGMDDAVVSHKFFTGDEEPKAVKETAAIYDHTAAIRRLLSDLAKPEYGVIEDPKEIAAVGHRVVHGGESLVESALITPEVKEMIRENIDLAPLHNPPNLAGIEAVEAILPDVPQVAVTDTAFHATMPRTAFLYALPYAMYMRHRVRRYGFHGTSHRYVSGRLSELMGRPLAGMKVITCHLGNGASVCAIEDGKSVDTSMGFTPLEGLVMGTRSGDIDPGIIPYLMNREEITIREMNSMLNKHSGLRGISGISGDMRQITQAMEQGDARAKDAYEMFVYRLRKYIGAYVAAMDGVDAIVFTGGIGENAAHVRADVCRRLTFFGVELDEEANAQVREGCITKPGSKVSAWVIPTNEELVIARDTAQIVRELARAGA